MKSITEIKGLISNIFLADTSNMQALQEICNTLKNKISYYDWVGFYFKNGEKQELKLKAFSGKPTEHTTIPYGKGICGQVAISNKKLVVPDVTTQDNYISCGWRVKSEIVVPIFVNQKNIGQIDIDSHSINPFTKQDEELLEFVCHLVAKKISETTKKNYKSKNKFDFYGI